MQGKNLMQYYSLKEHRKSINFASKRYKKHTKMTSRVKITNIKYHISIIFLKDHFGRHVTFLYNRSGVTFYNFEIIKSPIQKLF